MDRVSGIHSALTHSATVQVSQVLCQLANYLPAADGVVYAADKVSKHVAAVLSHRLIAAQTEQTTLRSHTCGQSSGH